MNDFGESFAQSVRTQLEKLGKNAFALEKEAGLPVDAIRSVIREDDKRAVPRITRAKEICDLLGLDLYIGPPRTPEAMGETQTSAPSGVTLIPRYEVEASAGSGSHITAAAVKENIAFPTEWLSRFGTSPTNAVMVRARGDSMQPVIWHGDTLLVDLSRKTPPVRKSGGVSLRKGYQEDVYLVERDGGLLVKAVRRPDDETLILISENSSSYNPEILIGDDINTLRIVGRVMWWGHAA